MLIFSMLLYLVCSVILQKGLFGRFSLSKTIQTFFLVVFSYNIVIFGVLSLLGWANQLWIALFLQVLFCSVTCALIIKRYHLVLNSLWNEFIARLKSLSIIDYLLIALVAVVLGAFFAVGITTPPNNIDSLDATHLTRIYYGMQQGSLLLDSLHEVARPLNIHIVHFWLFLLGGSENLFFIVQWFSLLVGIITIYQISLFLGFSRTKSLLGSIVVIALPVVLLQTYSSQGDLTVAVLVLMAIFYAVEYVGNRKSAELLFSAISLIIALGTKNTAFLVLPLFGIYIIVWTIRNIRLRKVNPKLLILIFILLVFSGSQFIVNIIRTGSFFGNGSILGYDYSSFNNFWEKAKYNLPRYAYQLIGFDGLPVQVQRNIANLKGGVFSRLTSTLGVDIEDNVFLQPGFSQGEVFRYDQMNDLNEDSAWFGPLALLIPFSIIFSLFSKNKARRNYGIFTFLLFTTYLFLVFLQRPGWDPYQSRYFITAVIPGVALIPMLIPDKGYFKKIISLIIIFISLIVICFSFFTNTSKPIINQKESHDFIYAHYIPTPTDNSTQIFIKEKLRYIFAYLAVNTPDKSNIYEMPYINQVYFNDLPTGKDVAFINGLVPEEETITFWFHEKNMEYGLFGKNKTRDLIPLSKEDQVIDGYFVTYSLVELEPSDTVKLVGDNGDFKVYYFDIK